MNRKERRAQQAKTKRATGPNADLETVSAQAIDAYRKGNLAEAEQSFRRACELAPQSAAAAFNLGHVLDRRGAHPEAIAQYRRALSIRPDYAEAWFNLANALRQQGDNTGAVEAYRRAATIRPDLAEAHNNLGNLLLAQDRLEEAQQAYRAAVTQRPDYHEAISNWFHLADMLQVRRHDAEAIDTYQQLLRLQPNNAEGHNRLGVSLDRLGRYAEAEAAFREAIALGMNSASAYSNLGNSLAGQGRIPEAEAAYHQSLAMDSTFPAAHNNLGLVLAAKGDATGAETAYRRALQLDPCFTEAYHNITTLKKITSLESDDVRNMKCVLNEPLTDSQRMRLCFALGKAHDDCHAYEQAFFYYEQANKLKRASTAFDIGHFRSHVDRIIQVFDADFFARTMAGSDDETPVFIVGMPRSATTLVEQIIASHPRVYGAGELIKINDIVRQLENPPEKAARAYPECVLDLTRDEIGSAANDYLEHLKRCVRGQDPDIPPAFVRVADKMPFNFIHLGLIALLFPKARVIHCRRNPLDTCLSNYFQLFPKGAEYSYSLEEAGLYYKEYERLMHHWTRVLPIKPLEVVYESLITDVESQAKKIIDHLALEWNEACLQFYNSQRTVRTLSLGQVRRPIYRQSQHRWKNYAAHIEPLMRILDIADA